MTAPVTLTVPDAGDPIEDGIAWARQAEAGEIYTDRAFVRWLLAELRIEGRWEDVLDVARATHHAMGQGGRWGTWQIVLEAAREAAVALGDRAAEAWALHQLGSRDLLRDDLGAARNELHRALALREAIGDLEGAEVTRHNLRILPLALAGVMTMLTLFVGLVALLIPSFDHPEIPQAIRVLDIADEVVTVDEIATGDFPIRLENRGTVALVGLAVASQDPQFVVTGELVDCEAIAIGGSCELNLTLTDDGGQPVVELASPLIVTLSFDEGLEQQGDTRILIRPTG
ncbi:MAG: hypothetical protein AAF548_08830 [Actinomycetota bacterium]